MSFKLRKIKKTFFLPVMFFLLNDSLQTKNKNITLRKLCRGGSVLVSRNVVIDGHRTSLRLEPPMWDALFEICERENISIHELCTLIDERKGHLGRTSAIRVFVMSYYRAAATDVGHTEAGHGASLGHQRQSLKVHMQDYLVS